MNLTRCAAMAVFILVLGGLVSCSSIKETIYNTPATEWVATKVSSPRVEMGPPMLITMSDRPMQHGQFAFPQVRRLPDQSLVLFWSTQWDTGSLDVESPREALTEDRGGATIAPLSPAHSFDGGMTWQSQLPDIFRDTIPSEFALYRRFNAGLFKPIWIDGWIVTSNGATYAWDRKVLMLTHEARKGRDFQAVGVGKRIAPDGVTVEYFESIFRIPDLDRTMIGGEALRIMPHGFEMPDGSLVLVANCKGTIVPYKYECNCDGDTSHLYRSVDGGKSFDFYATIATPRDAPANSTDGATEPCVIRLADGRLLAAMRTAGLGAGTRIKASGPLLMAYSDSEGTNWTTFLSSRKGVQPCLLRLQNGVIALSSGRPGTYITFSLDDGRTWVESKYVVPPETPTTSYTDMIEIEPNKILLFYDIREFEPPGEKLLHPSQGYNAILARFITVSRD